jgi:hypothetical protein
MRVEVQEKIKKAVADSRMSLTLGSNLRRRLAQFEADKMEGQSGWRAEIIREALDQFLKAKGF